MSSQGPPPIQHYDISNFTFHNGDTLPKVRIAYQILNPGMHHWFSADREAVIGYVDAGYPQAEQAAESGGLRIPMAE